MRHAPSLRRLRATRALVLAVVLPAALLTACAVSDEKADGAYIRLYPSGDIRSIWLLDGSAAKHTLGSCNAFNLDDESSTLSEDRTRVTDAESGDIYLFEWYQDGTGFVWKSHGDYLRADSELATAAIESWEAECGRTFPD